MVLPAADLVENLILSSVDFHDGYADAINAASACALKSPRCAWDSLMMSFVFSSQVHDGKHMLRT